jgi:hypothetical protein
MLNLAAQLAVLLVAMDDDGAALIPLLLGLSGFIFFTWVYLRYRNTDKRHHHERETTTSIENMRRYDNLAEHRKGLSNARMKDSNESQIEGALSQNALPKIMQNIGGAVGMKFDK